MEALNALSFQFKQLNDKLECFSNPSSSDIHCIPIDTDLENFICREKAEESKDTFSKAFQNEFQKKLSNQNEDSKLYEESQEFQISRFSFFKLKNLDLLQSIRQMICEKAKTTGEAKQEHIMQFLADCSTFGITIQGMSFTWIFLL